MFCVCKPYTTHSNYIIKAQKLNAYHVVQNQTRSRLRRSSRSKTTSPDKRITVTRSQVGEAGSSGRQAVDPVASSTAHYDATSYELFHKSRCALYSLAIRLVLSISILKVISSRVRMEGLFG